MHRYSYRHISSYILLRYVTGNQNIQTDMCRRVMLCKTQQQVVIILMWKLWNQRPRYNNYVYHYGPKYMSRSLLFLNKYNHRLPLKLKHVSPGDVYLR